MMTEFDIPAFWIFEKITVQFYNLSQTPPLPMKITMYYKCLKKLTGIKMCFEMSYFILDFLQFSEMCFNCLSVVLKLSIYVALEANDITRYTMKIK